MTRRKNFKTALAKHPPQYTPLDLGGSITGITRKAYKGLCSHLNRSAEAENIEVIVKPLQLVEISEEILRFLDIDTRYVRPNFGIDSGLEEEYQDDWDVVRRLSANGLYYDIVDFPLKEGTAQELEKLPIPDPKNPALFEGLKEEAKRIKHETDFVLVGDPLAPALFEIAWYLRGLENFLVDLLHNEKYARTLFETLLDFQLQFFTCFLDEVGEFLDVMMMGDDLGTQNGPLMSPQMYRESVKPFHTRLFSHIKSNTDAALFLHSCGGVEPLIPDLLDAGINILHPIQTKARFMDHANLKEKYGNNLIFWGGIDIQEGLIGDQTLLKQVIREEIDTLGYNGGYVLSPGHNIQADTPPENIVTLYHYAKEYSGKPAKT